MPACVRFTSFCSPFPFCMRLSLVRAPLLLGLCFLLLGNRASAQAEPPERGRLDLSVWTAGATGKENTGSFAEAQVWSTGVFFGWVVIANAGSGWRRGGLEYGFNLLPAV